ncbi:hypothetical protein FDG94_gp079 [Pseudomonas phage SM1]|uniref:Uncharacterized protein n=2 Tax=Samunavirus TaxID=2560221 RepID=A0A0U3E008_9CAUD|nr:hypothetical protein FDG94_gp079 [Pseudomonas phage SM1]ALT58071.1 hypothetical protein SM1_079 [Pseudomonas phage SM1]
MATKLYIVEVRDSDGNLVLSPQSPPPFATASERQLQEYHDEVTGDYMAEFRDVLGWYRTQGWHVRRRPW